MAARGSPVALRFQGVVVDVSGDVGLEQLVARAAGAFGLQEDSFDLFDDCGKVGTSAALKRSLRLAGGYTLILEVTQRPGSLQMAEVEARLGRLEARFQERLEAELVVMREAIQRELLQQLRGATALPDAGTPAVQEPPRSFEAPCWKEEVAALRAALQAQERCLEELQAEMQRRAGAALCRPLAAELDGCARRPAEQPDGAAAEVDAEEERKSPLAPRRRRPFDKLVETGCSRLFQGPAAEEAEDEQAASFSPAASTLLPYSGKKSCFRVPGEDRGAEASSWDVAAATVVAAAPFAGRRHHWQQQPPPQQQLIWRAAGGCQSLPQLPPLR